MNENPWVHRHMCAVCLAIGGIVGVLAPRDVSAWFVTGATVAALYCLWKLSHPHDLY